MGITPEVREYILGAIKSPCGFEDFDYTLCCVDTRSASSSSTTTTTPRTTTTVRTTTTRRTTTTTRASQQLKNCGIQGDGSRIVDGEEAKIGSWPWAAILGIPTGSDGIRVLCGATVIRNDYVLTAAHCFDGGQSPTVVRMADLDINSRSDRANHEQVGIQRTIIHPE